MQARYARRTSPYHTRAGDPCVRAGALQLYHHRHPGIASSRAARSGSSRPCRCRCRCAVHQAPSVSSSSDRHCRLLVGFTTLRGCAPCSATNSVTRSHLAAHCGSSGAGAEVRAGPGIVLQKLEPTAPGRAPKAQHCNPPGSCSDARAWSLRPACRRRASPTIVLSAGPKSGASWQASAPCRSRAGSQGSPPRLAAQSCLPPLPWPAAALGTQGLAATSPPSARAGAAQAQGRQGASLPCLLEPSRVLPPLQHGCGCPGPCPAAVGAAGPCPSALGQAPHATPNAQPAPPSASPRRPRAPAASPSRRATQP